MQQDDDALETICDAFDEVDDCTWAFVATYNRVAPFGYSGVSHIYMYVGLHVRSISNEKIICHELFGTTFFNYFLKILVLYFVFKI